MDRRAFSRSTSFPTFRNNGNIDEALSRGFRRSQFAREYLQGIPPHLDDEISSVTKEHEDLKKEHEDLKKEHEDLKKEHEDLKKEHEDLKKEHEDLKKEHEDLKKEHEDVKKEHEDLQKKTEDLQKETEDLQKKNEDLQKKNEDLQKMPCAVELRQVLSNFLKSKRVNKDLMEKAQETYPNEFSQETGSFTATIGKLLGEKGKEHKLNCLREVAKSFKPSKLRWWDEKKGEQFYILCEQVAVWNMTTFHPQIEGVRRCIVRSKANSGSYMVGGEDLGPLVVRLLRA